MVRYIAFFVHSFPLLWNPFTPYRLSRSSKLTYLCPSCHPQTLPPPATLFRSSKLSSFCPSCHLQTSPALPLLHYSSHPSFPISVRTLCWSLTSPPTQILTYLGVATTSRGCFLIPTEQRAHLSWGLRLANCKMQESKNDFITTYSCMIVKFY